MALLASARFLGAPLTKKSIWEFFRIKNWCATLFVAKSVPRPFDGRGEADGGPGCGGREAQVVGVCGSEFGGSKARRRAPRTGSWEPDLRRGEPESSPDAVSRGGSEPWVRRLEVDTVLRGV